MAPPSSSNATARLELRLGDVCEIELVRPDKANALDWRAGEEFASALTRVSEHEAARVLVLRGRGRNFCAGGDFGFIEQNTTLPPDEVERRMRRYYGLFLGVLDVPVPTLAVVQGSAIGAGLCLALACDVRVGTRDARLGLGFLRLGLHPGMGATALAPLRAPGRAEDLLLTGDVIDGSQGERCGLLSRAVPRDRLTETVDELIEKLRSAAPQAARQTVATLRRPLKSRLREALDQEARRQRENFAGTEVREAVAAFRERRPPRF